MSGKYALITGANKGIGLEIARQLGQKGFHVLLGARNLERGEKAVQGLKSEGISAMMVPLEVSDEGSIRQAFEQVNVDIPHLDVLVNNAGILVDATETLLTVATEDIYHTLHINAIGALLVTRVFYPLLNEGSRVIMVSSGLGAIGKGVSGYAPIYSVSKTTMNAITLQLAKAFEGSGIAINAVSPGWVKTDMGGANAARSVEKGAETPVWLATEAPISLTGKFFHDKEEIPW